MRRDVLGSFAGFVGVEGGRVLVLWSLFNKTTGLRACGFIGGDSTMDVFPV